MKPRHRRRCSLAALAGCCLRLHSSTSAFVAPYSTCMPQFPSTAIFLSNSNNNNNNNDNTKNENKEQQQVDVNAVTDAEALLACRAYLQRKNRLGSWKDYQRRKESLRQASAAIGSSTGAGYFWENPEELIYLDRGDMDTDDIQDDSIIQEQDRQQQQEEEEHGVIYESIEEQDGGVTMILGTTLSALERGTEFTSLPTSPSQERINRSNAAKKTWSDPEWKAMWYEKRWGRLRNTTPSASKQKRLDDKIRSMPPKLFESQELASLSEEEIEEAIRTYVVSNRKRSRAHTTDAKLEKKRLEKQQQAERAKGMGEQSKIDFMLFGSNEAMKEAQRKRSERATKAYQTRLKNQNRNRPTQTSSSKRTIPTDALPVGKTPKEALVRVQAALESDQLPFVEDVQLILEPPKLGRRKDLLRRILNEHFDLRGKCVPAGPSNKDSDEFLFVTQCSIDQLGSFVLEKMNEKAGSSTEDAGKE